jgi:hypothetical protein
MPDGLLGLIRRIDPTFAPLRERCFRVVNQTGVMIDLITPESRDPMRTTPRRKRRLGGRADLAIAEDIEAIEVPRLEMIVDAPRFTTTAVTESGLPVWIAAADPRWWAAHKLWLASEASRERIKRQRDRDQGHAVAAMLATAWEAVDLSDTALASIPAALRQGLRDAVANGAARDPEVEW